MRAVFGSGATISGWPLRELALAAARHLGAGDPHHHASCSFRRERATTHPAWALALWPVLTRPRMAGFEVSTGGQISLFGMDISDITSGMGSADSVAGLGMNL